MGRFFGLKPHLICDERGELLNFMITHGDVDGIQLIMKLRNNMKGALMSVSDKLLLRKRAIIETVNDELKNIAQAEHSRHWCFENFIVNTLGALAAYCLFPKKAVYLCTKGC